MQEVIAEQGWGGRVMPTSDDYLMVVDSSLNSTKLNLVVEPKIEMDIALDDLGNARNTVTVTYATTVTYALSGTATAILPQVITNTAVIVAPGYQTITRTAIVRTYWQSVYLPLVMRH